MKPNQETINAMIEARQGNLKSIKNAQSLKSELNNRILDRVTDKDSLYDAIEIGVDFVTVYINSNEPGLPGSVQRQFLDEFSDIIKDPNLHDPSRFHEDGDPRGDKWRVWKNKYGCHFHIPGQPTHILQILNKRLPNTKVILELVRKGD